jgi:hypothetical protein
LTRRRALAALALAAAGLGWACGEPQPEAEPPPPAPVSVRGAVLVEPPRLAIGEVAVVEVAVVTPPDHRVRPIAPPEAIPGLWLLDVETPPASRESGRWVHRTRFRVRARQIGSFTWPAQEVQVERPDGGSLAVSLEERPIEVESVAREMPGRAEPFGLRGPPERAARPGGFWGPALFGAFAALAAVGLVHLVRRERAGAPLVEAGAAPHGGIPGGEWHEAVASLAAAGEDAERSPAEAADRVSAALRGFVTRRFGLRADALTSEELAGTTPPFAMTTRWPALVALLARLDALRFRAAPEPDAADELRACAAEARQLLSGYAPGPGPGDPGGSR